MVSSTVPQRGDTGEATYVPVSQLTWDLTGQVGMALPQDDASVLEAPGGRGAIRSSPPEAEQRHQAQLRKRGGTQAAELS